MQLMLVNPSPRKKKMRRTAKQKAATKKLVALNKRRARVKRNPAKRKAPARKRVAVSAPSRATGKRPTKHLTARRKANTKRGYFPNPARRSKITIKNVMKNQVQPAAIQASGALMLDVGYGYFGSYIPDMFNTGMTKHVTKSVIAIGMGMLAGNFMKNETANKLALGAMTVTMHDAMKEAVQTWMPNIPMGYYNPSPVSSGAGYFSNDDGQGIGYFSDDSGTGYAQQHEAFDTSEI